MPSHLVLIALLMLPHPWRHANAAGETRKVAGWTVWAHTDHFTNSVTCQVTRPSLTNERHALVLHLPRRTDTAAAVYRIDGGPLLSAGADALELAHLGFALHSDDLANPSGGLVRIPQRLVVDAHVVEVQTAADKRPVKFKIDGLGEALASARLAGCQKDALF